jgi:hypothetical protein
VGRIAVDIVVARICVFSFRRQSRYRDLCRVSISTPATFLARNETGQLDLQK